MDPSPIIPYEKPPSGATEAPPVFLGDKVESALASLGITKHLYRGMKRNLFLSDTCNCDERRKALNQFDKKVREGIRHLREEQLPELASLLGTTLENIKKRYF